ncbi:ANTH-domain-containing protein [Pseudovirgaria hyperparasitica]|uniref:ANTH-domain-containing protein n=1 Tax=Pseudovirgaria hyperparasitica TaxID=470096 RepID=A0A6A6W5W6_9PEZI|nr:ANTH-domain-containing protein [Pseudovirgaria hyperparasitica]KAF2757340.1 ANTH-domain-containing protein [Pseudovirgaria hyperparasitica]
MPPANPKKRVDVSVANKEKNEYIPSFISKKPFYVNDIDESADYLEHQRLQKAAEDSKWYDRGRKAGPAATKYRKGACENCGAMTHKAKDCLERPRKQGAKWTGKDIQADEIIQDVKLGWEAKRDRWNGFDSSEYASIVEEYNQLEAMKKAAQGEAVGARALTEGGEDDEGAKYEEETEMGRQQSKGTRNLRLREDTAKYLVNLDLDSAKYDPKTRSMVDSGATSDQAAALVAEEGFMRASGDAAEFERAQKYAWETQEQRGKNKIHLQANPTSGEVLRKKEIQEAEAKKLAHHKALLEKYGGQDEVTDKSLKETAVVESERYVEYDEHGGIKGAPKVKAKSKYPEDVLINNHTSVWGSWWSDFKWGYACCHSFVKNSYCTGEEGKTALEEASRLRLGESLGLDHNETPENYVEVVRAEQNEATAPADATSRKRTADVMAAGITEEEMDEYRRKRRQAADPMSNMDRACVLVPRSNSSANTPDVQRLERACSMAYHGSTRNVDMTKQESELAINIRKATSIDETAPKRKHVRSAIVYTWDHKSSGSFWAGMKVQPILADEVQTFKALQTIHKVLQEGHPIALKEAQANVNWIESLSRGAGGGDGLRGYMPLIQEYVYFLLAKLAFHRQHPEFNGTFEYEEYISLKSINDPNEGYETISDLMTLQDQIDSFQKLIFSHFRSGQNNECRISALVPLVQESYGIYKFITSMLRAMHTTLGDDEALSPLRGRYDAQHYRLVKFYYECSNLRYLTSLITVPKLPQDPPNLLSEDESAPALPTRPAREVAAPKSPPKSNAPDPEPINEFWKNEQKRQQDEYEAEQRRLQAQWEEAQRLQQQQSLQAQRDFEEQQRLQQEQARLAHDQLLRDQYAQQTQGRLAELEQENLRARQQYEQDQLMLAQYDQRMKALEGELNQLNANFQQQSQSKDDQIRALQEQLNTWRTKYEALAKLYSQLRHEHLQLLQKFKQVQVKAASAQEAIDAREKLSRELKTKNLELADMIRERDKAYLDKDRSQGGHKEELEKLKRELRFAMERAENAERGKGSELSAMLSRHNREIADLEEALRNKTRQLEDFHMKYREGDSDLERQLREKEEELEIFKAGMDQTLLELNELKLGQGDTDRAMDGQIDSLILDNIKRINDIIDSVLQSGVQRVDEALYELDSSMQAGNQNASGAFVLSQIEKASQNAMEFSTAFNNFIADGATSGHAEIIRTVNAFSGSIADVLSNTKGLTRFASDDKKGDQLINAARQAASSTLQFFRNLQSFRLEGLEPLQKTDVVINNNNDVQVNLQKLSKLADAFAPKSKITNAQGDLGDLVDRELTNAANAIDAATERLTKLMNKPRDSYSTYELKIHDSILAAAIAVTNAIAQLIKAATASQQEIVREGRGAASRTAFYKKHNRWTEGLISAAKAVASSTNLLIETADGVISGRNSPEQLIVASNDVAASTAQLVAASRVKASFMSKSQDRLETASKAVTSACRSLVRQVQEIIAQRNRDDNEVVDYSKLSGHEFKVQEMEQQVEILQLENSLAQARTRLGEMRKISYQQED